jgi:putative ABC transport system permease protein
MIRFLLKGLLRDKSRSRLPVIVVAMGVTLTVLLHAYIVGFMGDIIEINARFSTGHLKVMTKAYARDMDQLPNDLALTETDTLIEYLNREFPQAVWSPRIHFAGLIDVPDEKGETRSQGPALGLGIDLLTPGSAEVTRLNLEKSVARGRLPVRQGEIILSEGFTQKLRVNPGDTVTLISSTMDGSMAFSNFVVSGTILLGLEALDRGTVITDIEDVRTVLNMDNAAAEITGFFKSGFYDDDLALSEADRFTSLSADNNDDYSPVMKSLSSQGSLGLYVNMVELWTVLISLIFIIAMSLVLWNAGLLGGLRRYGEIGIRLAMGEEKGHVYLSMIYESVMIGMAGSVIGTMIGLFFAWLIQKYGIDISGMMKGSAVMIPSEIRARIQPVDFYIGFVPGLISTVIGTMLSGIGIYKRQTAKLFKELEV